MLNNNPVLVARHFQYKVEVLFKVIIIDGPLGKTKYYAIRIEFQERGSPHVHSFIWILDPPSIQDEASYINFIEKTINAQLPDPQNDPELLSYLRHTKFMLILEFAGNTTRMNVAFSMVDFLQRRQLLQNQLILNLAKIKNKRF